MGIFSVLFGSASDAERMILRTYPAMLQGMTGMPASEAQRLTREMLESCKQESVGEGTDKLIANFGDSLLVREQTDSSVAAMLGGKRKQGITDDDIRWWWNLDDLERRMMIKVDELSRTAMFMQLRDSGVSRKEGAARVKQTFPIYGSPSPDDGDDPPLPYEIKDRVAVFIGRCIFDTDTDQYKSEVESYPSYDAFIRAKVQTGDV